jgi:O-antigen/teichoic acid export membrane protein
MVLRKLQISAKWLSAVRQRILGRIFAIGGMSALQALLSVAILPFATKVLSASDYGLYGLMLSIAGFATMFADSGGSLALPAHYDHASEHERREMLATFFFVSLSIGFLIGIAFILCIGTLAGSAVGNAAATPFSIIFITAMLIPLRSLSSLTTTVFSVSGRGIAIALQIGAQAVVTFAAVLLGLFVFHLGGLSLFLGALLGQTAYVSVGFVLLRRHIWARPRKRWFHMAKLNAPTAAVTGLIDSARGMVENVAISGVGGPIVVGLVNHARLYSSFASTGIKSVSLNIWSVSLIEARANPKSMPLTHEAWSFIATLVGLFGILFTGVCSELISAITNGVFVKSAPLSCLFLYSLILQLLGRSDIAVIFQSGGAAALARVRSAIVVVSAAAGLALYYFTGDFILLGWSALAETLAYTALLRYNARFLRPTAGYESSVFSALVSCGIVWGAKFCLDLSLGAVILITAVTAIGYLVLSRGIVLAFAQRIRRSL